MTNKFERVLSDDEMAVVINNGCAADLFSLAQRVEQAILAKLAEHADMFWDMNNSETSGESIHDILISSDVSTGEFVQIQRAKSLEDITIRVTSYDVDKNEFTWEVTGNE